MLDDEVDFGAVSAAEVVESAFPVEQGWHGLHFVDEDRGAGRQRLALRHEVSGPRQERERSSGFARSSTSEPSGKSDLISVDLPV